MSDSANPVGSGLKQVGNTFGLGDATEMGEGGAFKMSGKLGQYEADVLKKLSGQAQKGTTAVSNAQYKMALDNLRKQQASAAASARGVSNLGILQREAMQQSQQGQMELSQQANLAKIQEKLASQQAAQQAILNQANAQRGTASQSAAANLQSEQLAQQRRADFFANLGSSGSKMYAASDENVKENIKESKNDANKLVEQFMDALKSYSYNYKEKENNGKENPKGEVTSVMAQDLEKSKLGKKMVKEGPDGKMVDYAQGFAPLFAAIAELNERTKKLEKKG
jgi:hypothetical protein